MEYNLIEGLSAVGAFGIVILANANLCNRFSEKINNRVKESTFTDNLIFILAFFSILGISYIAGFLGFIIINSKVIIYPYLIYFIGFSLLITILLPQFSFYLEAPLKITLSIGLIKKNSSAFARSLILACSIMIYWPIMLGLFMFTLSEYALIGMFVPPFLFLINSLFTYQKK